MKNIINIIYFKYLYFVTYIRSTEFLNFAQIDEKYHDNSENNRKS